VAAEARRRGLGLALAALPGLASSLAWAQVPAPAGTRHLFDLGADGVQVYACQAREGGPAWVFQAPDAALFDAAGRQQGTHGAGPHWQLADGSRVTGTVIETTPATGSIPWLLLRATPAGPPGQLHGVAFIRRFGTDERDAAHLGAVVRMRYRATYGFYGP
jgi:hypothetical protein